MRRAHVSIHDLSRVWESGSHEDTRLRGGCVILKDDGKKAFSITFILHCRNEVGKTIVTSRKQFTGQFFSTSYEKIVIFAFLTPDERLSPHACSHRLQR